MNWFPKAIDQLKDCPKELRVWLVAWMFFRTTVKYIVGPLVAWYVIAKLHLK